MSVLPVAHSALSEGWSIAGRLAPLGAGLINDTFAVYEGADTQGPDKPPRWVLQRINQDVFADPVTLMDNVSRAVRHLAARAPSLVPELRATRDAREYFMDPGDSVWRLWAHVSGEIATEALSEARARSAAAIFARFQSAMADLPGERLAEVIPGFMRLPDYLQALDRLLERARSTEPEVSQALQQIYPHRWLAKELQVATGYIHGDCKVNNLVFRGDEACCVLDLDTVMYGHWAWDFGDLVRSGANARGRFSPALFEAMAQGFAAGSSLSVDAASLVLAPRYVAVMLGVRFLTDHLAGDVYFRVSRRGENLQRSLEQLALATEMASLEDRMGQMADAALR